MPAYFDHYRGLASQCYRGFVLSFLDSVFIGIYFYLTIYLTDKLHFTMAEAGIIMSCYGVGAIVGGILGGKLSDRVPPGLVTAGAMLMQSLAFFAFTQLSAMILLMGNVFMLGIASYGFITANHLYVLSYCHHDSHQRLKALNILATTANLGFGLSAMLLVVVTQIDFKPAFLIAAGVLLICAVLAYDNASINAPQTLPENFNQSLHARKKVVALTLLCVFGVGLIVAQIGSTYAIYVKNAFPAAGANAFSLLLALNAFMVVLLGVPVGERIKQFNKIHMVGLGALLMGAGMFMLIFSYCLYVAALANVVYTLGEIIFFSVAQLVCYQNGLQQKKGQALGTFRMVYASTRIIGPAAGGLIFTWLGGNAVWMICGLIGLCCYYFCYRYLQHDLKVRVGKEPALNDGSLANTPDNISSAA